MDKINKTSGVLKEMGIFSTRTLRVALLGIMIITLFLITWNVGSWASTPESDFEFDQDTGTITGYNGEDSDVVIPSEIGDVTVTTIGDYAFYKCISLTSITIPDSVTSIGEYAFDGCTSLTSITLSDSLTTIGKYAFSGCSSLASVTLSDSLITIGYGAFCGCSSLTSITLPDSLTSIDEGAFYGCSGLTSITLPDSLTHSDYTLYALV